MSKAFTREDNTAEERLPDREPVLPPGVKNYMTPGGAERMRLELVRLQEVERPELERQAAQPTGDDRDAAKAVAAAKQALRDLERRIRYLTGRLDTAEVVDPALQEPGVVRFGATVTVRDDDGRTRTIRLVGIDEVDAKQGRVSWLSPIARAVLHAKPGDVVIFESPKGEEELEVLEVRYESE